MKVHVIRRGIERNLWLAGEQEPIQVAYCGYLEVEYPFNEDLWEWCNWDCWSWNADSSDVIKPKECEHLLIGHCNSDVAYYINGKWYSHEMKEFSNFYHCYHELIWAVYNKYFNCLWPLNYGFIDKRRVRIVTPENINNFIK